MFQGPGSQNYCLIERTGWTMFQGPGYQNYCRLPKDRMDDVSRTVMSELVSLKGRDGRCFKDREVRITVSLKGGGRCFKDREVGIAVSLKGRDGRCFKDLDVRITLIEKTGWTLFQGPGCQNYSH